MSRCWQLPFIIFINRKSNIIILSIIHNRSAAVSKCVSEGRAERLFCSLWTLMLPEWAANVPCSDGMGVRACSDLSFLYMNVASKHVNVKSKDMNVESKHMNIESKDMNVKSKHVNIESKDMNIESKHMNIESKDMNVYK